ncbi:MAG: tetratricopeptide repeat protein [Bacteroidota bacterium]
MSLSEAEKKELTKKLVYGGFNYHQGTSAHQFQLFEANKYDTTFSEIHRELGIPYLKRGIAHTFYPHFQKVIQYDVLNWQGWRGYNYLFFYRDYERALQDFIEMDNLTPGVVDHPQALNIDYLKAICYLKMGDHQNALQFFNKQIKYEMESVGVEYMEPVSFLYRGIAYWEIGEFAKAKRSFEMALENDRKNADAAFWLAKYWLQAGNQKKAKEMIAIAKDFSIKGYDLRRPYVEAFYQTYLADIEEFATELGKL